MNACVLFATLTDASPVGLEIYSNGKTGPEHAVTKEDGEFIQKMAWAQYQEIRPMGPRAVYFSLVSLQKLLA